MIAFHGKDVKISIILKSALFVVYLYLYVYIYVYL